MTIAVDDREQLPFAFHDHPQARYRLDTGDYSLVGFEDRIAVERKSLADLYQTLTGGRQRFVREIERARKLESFSIVVEADWLAVIDKPGIVSTATPKVILNTVFSWTSRYPHVHWFFCPDRSFAELATLRLLSFFYQHKTEAGHGATEEDQN